MKNVLMSWALALFILTGLAACGSGDKEPEAVVEATPAEEAPAEEQAAAQEEAADDETETQVVVEESAAEPEGDDVAHGEKDDRRTDPDRALGHLERFMRATLGPLQLVSELAERPHAMELLARAFGASTFMAQILVRNPSWFHWLADPRVLERSRGRAAIESDLDPDVAAVTEPLACVLHTLDATERARTRYRLGAREAAARREGCRSISRARRGKGLRPVSRPSPAPARSGAATSPRRSGARRRARSW